jgi:hypothetical protein
MLIPLIELLHWTAQKIVHKRLCLELDSNSKLHYTFGLRPIGSVFLTYEAVCFVIRVVYMPGEISRASALSGVYLYFIVGN